MPGRRFERQEVIVCAYVAMYGDEDLGGLARAAESLNRDAGSLRLKVQNIVAMLDVRGLPRNPTTRPLAGRTTGRPPHDTDWVVIEPFTRILRNEHLAVCRLYLQR